MASGGNLGAFTNGIFGGAQAVQNITATSQELQQRQYALNAAQAVQAASSDPYAVQDPGGAVQPIQETGTAVAPDTGGTDQPPSSSGALPTTSGPVADISKLPPLATKAPPAAAVQPAAAAPPAAAGPPVSAQDAQAATDPLSAGDSTTPPATSATPALTPISTSSTPPPAKPAVTAQDVQDPAAIPGLAALADPKASLPVSGASSLGARILNAINPVGTASAATSSPLPAPPQADAPASGALSDTIDKLRQPPAASQGDIGPAAVNLPQQPMPGQAPDARTSNDVTTRTAFDPRPYTALVDQAPAYAKMVDQAADKYNVTPARLALHWNNESSLNTTAPTSKDGDVGPLQLQPSTVKMLDPAGTRDPTKLSDALDLAAQNIHLADTRYGRDTPLSVAAYQGGNGSADAIAAGEGAHHPNTVAYMAKSFPGQTLGPDQLQPGHAMSPGGIVQAAQQGGPDAVLNFVARSGPAAAPLSDKWRQAESALMTAAAAKGDVAGMAHARDFVFQQLHQGNATSLINAYQALQSGDGVSAAQQLARANAFFPDGATSRFGTDAQGNVWMQRVDEHDPTKVLEPPTQVTPQRLQTMLIQTEDPNQFAQVLSEQQKNVAQARLYQQHGDYYEQLPAVKQALAAQQGATQEAVAKARAGALVQAAGVRAGSSEYGADQRRGGQDDRIAAGASGGASGSAPLGANGVKQSQVDGEATKIYGAPDATPGGPLPLEQQALGADIHHDLRMNTPGMTTLGAKSMTLGLLNGSNVLRPVAPGRFGIYQRSAQSGSPLAVVSAATAQRYQRTMTPRGLGNPGGALGGVGTPPPAAVQPSQSALPVGATPGGF